MDINIKVSDKVSAKIEADVLVIPVDSSVKILGSLPDNFKKDLHKQLKNREFQGKWAEMELLVAPAGISYVFVAVIGLGDKKQAEGLRRGLANALKDARHHLLRKIVVDLSGQEQCLELVNATVESALLFDYRFDTYSKKIAQEQKKRSLHELTLVTESERVSELKKEVKRSQNIMAGVELTRHLVNLPASDMSPRHLVDFAQQVSKGSDTFTLKVLDKKKAGKEGFSAFLDVAKGSLEEPYVIHLIYKPKKKSRRKIALVGKGVTFDSGGLSLKPAEYMEAMKIDMGGAATVLGAMSALPKLAVDVEVHAVIPTCENMPSGSAYRPGDVLTARNGKTIEVLNTDAEGRIILADALSYAIDQKPDAVVDLATLTGACLVALGDTYAGLFSNNKELSTALLRAASRVGEGLTALPMPEEYRPLIESKVADVRNIGASRYGGAITAAMFLEEFVDEAVWAHIDLAGPAFSERDSLPYYTYGGTGYGVRTILDWLQSEV